MENGLNEKLTRIEDTVSIMKTNLRLSESEIIERVAEATNLKTLTNVFVQPNEPEIKDGIWIEAQSDGYDFEHLIIDNNTIVPGKWRFDKALTINSGLGSTFYSTPGRPRHIIYLNGCMYLCNATSGKYLIKYDLTTHALTKYTPTEYSYYDMITNGVDKIYLIASQYVETFDITTNTFTKKKYYDSTTYSGSSWRTGCYSAYDNSLYLLSPDNNRYLYFGKIDLATGTYTRITTYNNSGKLTYHIMPHGNEIILLPGQENSIGKIYNIDDAALYDLTAYDIQNCICTACYSACDFDAYHYIFNLTQMSEGGNIASVYKIHKDALTYEDVTDEFQDSELAPVIGIMNDGNGFYAYRGTDVVSSGAGYQKGMLIPMDMGTASYDNNVVIIVQAGITRSEKQTAIWTYPFIQGRLLQSFYDVYYYNKETGFDLTLPMYYGDGSQWIKWK